MSVIKFGTDGWRAIIAQDFTFDNLKIVAQGIANYMKIHNLSKRGVIIGYDNRFLSEKFAHSCAEVFLGNGIKTYMFHVAVPTPVTAFAIRHLEAGGAVMITASHNPPEYSGIKFIPEYAGPALPDVTNEIEEEIQRIIDGGKVYELEVEEAQALDLFEEINLDKEYISHLMHIIRVDAFQDRNLKIVVNPMYGSGIGYLDHILMELGCEVKTINNYRDAFFGGSMPEPTDEILSDMKRMVQTFEADLGLALDGDADRFGLVDADGSFISPNRFAYLLFDHLIQTRTFRGPVCRTIATTHMLDQVAKDNGLSVVETPVGFKYISQGLREKGCILGIEESGGLSIFGHIPEKDGILACLLAAEMVAYSGKTLGELEQDFEERYGSIVSRRFDIRVSPEEHVRIRFLLDEYQPRTIAGVKVDEINDTEGKKFIMEDGSWVLIRASGTEPVFRIYVEAVTEDRLAEIYEDVKTSLEIETD
ncbi:MAG TPA: phosphoglucomutase/phosphomannomutase family protein [Syntrophomonadaceae bacterium]|nr:phosphoglucomutase/phosphomannomutase family protein [Syntrophomonadaceae bacterium]